VSVGGGHGIQEWESMIKILEDAIEKLRQLPEVEQESVARFVLHELAEDRAWRGAGEIHTASLSTLVSEVIAEDDRGECPDLDPERM
jgi:hypothetical protein